MTDHSSRYLNTDRMLLIPVFSSPGYHYDGAIASDSVMTCCPCVTQCMTWQWPPPPRTHKLYHVKILHLTSESCNQSEHGNRRKWKKHGISCCCFFFNLWHGSWRSWTTWTNVLLISINNQRRTGQFLKRGQTVNIARILSRNARMARFLTCGKFLRASKPLHFLSNISTLE